MRASEGQSCPTTRNCCSQSTSGIRFDAPAEGEEERLKALWRSSFDDGDFSDRFFKSAYRPGVAEAAYDGGEIVSALYMLPYEIRLHKSRLRSFYLYAAATLPGRRGAGLMSGLMSRAFTAALGRGCVCSATVPASPSLFDYYARFGYAPFFNLVDVAVPSPDNPPDIDSPARFERLASGSAGLLAKLYTRRVGDFPCACLLGEGELAFYIDDPNIAVYLIRLQYGDRSSGDGDLGYFIADESASPVRIMDFYPGGDARNGGRAGQMIKKISAFYGGRKLVFNLPEGEYPGLGGILRPYGMLRVLDARAFLEAHAASASGAEFSVSIADGIIPENNRSFTVSGGGVKPARDGEPMDISRLPGLVAERLGGLPPYMNLMMD